MVIAYSSRTGNVRRFVNKLTGYDIVEITEGLKLSSPFIIITYTTGFGKVPDAVESFLDENEDMLLGVSASGNRNWGTLFANSADLISKKYNVPIISKFELAGTTSDVNKFMEGVNKFETHRT